MRPHTSDQAPDQALNQSSDRGETLIELLVAVMIMSTAVLVLAGGIAATIRFSDVHRKQAAAGAYLRTFAEQLENAVAATPTSYTPCATTATYASVFSTGTTNYVAEVVAVTHWSGSAFGSTCTPSADLGVQRVSLRVRSADGAAVETLDVILRRPCRSTTDFPLDPPCV